MQILRETFPNIANSDAKLISSEKDGNFIVEKWEYPDGKIEVNVKLVKY